MSGDCFCSTIYILCSLVTGFAAIAVTAVIRYFSDYLKLKVRYFVL